MTYWKKPGPMRKILRASTLIELTKFIEENAKRHWNLISEIHQVNGRFEVLIELKNGVYKQKDSVEI
jgi:hypothetical protein